jgi:hypothetical protein
VNSCTAYVKQYGIDMTREEEERKRRIKQLLDSEAETRAEPRVDPKT